MTSEQIHTRRRERTPKEVTDYEEKRMPPPFSVLQIRERERCRRGGRKLDTRGN